MTPRAVAWLLLIFGFTIFAIVVISPGYKLFVGFILGTLFTIVMGVANAIFREIE